MTDRFGSKPEEQVKLAEVVAMPELVMKNSSKVVAGFSNLDDQDVWLMALITQADMVKPGSPVMNEAALDLLLTLYSEALEEVGKAAFQAAFLQVLKCSPFRPDISEIRKAAGINHGIVDPVERQAMSGFKLILAIMRVHGVQMKPLIGQILNDGKDEQGRVLQVPLRTPSVPAPALEARTEAAIAEMGYGSRVAGLEMIAGHPAISKECDERFRVKTATEIEKRWIASWRAV